MFKNVVSVVINGEIDINCCVNIWFQLLVQEVNGFRRRSGDFCGDDCGCWLVMDFCKCICNYCFFVGGIVNILNLEYYVIFV